MSLHTIKWKLLERFTRQENAREKQYTYTYTFLLLLSFLLSFVFASDQIKASEKQPSTSMIGSCSSIIERNNRSIPSKREKT